MSDSVPQTRNKMFISWRGGGSASFEYKGGHPRGHRSTWGLEGSLLVPRVPAFLPDLGLVSFVPQTEVDSSQF